MVQKKNIHTDGRGSRVRDLGERTLKSNLSPLLLRKTHIPDIQQFPGTRPYQKTFLLSWCNRVLGAKSGKVPARMTEENPSPWGAGSCSVETTPAVWPHAFSILFSMSYLPVFNREGWDNDFAIEEPVKAACCNAPERGANSAGGSVNRPCSLITFQRTLIDAKGDGGWGWSARG